ncbi:restriction endonuclease subunit S [Propionibacterium freudenreichii]|uniref:restriction endonuclease subunit S n=1 Tax=Propionibacterium freudenreichii TaxID=1744 RepID=UPI0021A58F7C|nr:restriction endonuclease subunit S [Propionibacterium freudenreichii]
MTVLPGLNLELPSSWSVATLAEVTSKIGSGATPRGGSSVYVASGPALIRSQNVYDHEFKSEGLAFLSQEAATTLRGVTVESGDVLINITGDSILRTVIVPDAVLPARVNQHVAIVRSNGKIHPGFLQKWLSVPLMKTYMLGYSSGGTRKAITKGHLQSFPIPLPPMEEQRAIAATLGALDDKIESNRRAVASISDLLDAQSEKFGADLPTVPLGVVATSVKDTVNPSKLGDAVVDHFSLPAFDSGARPERVAATTIKSNKLRVPQRAVLLSRLNPRFNRTWWASTRAGTSALASTEFLVLTSEDGLELGAVWLAVRDPFFREELPKRVTGTSGSHQRVRPDDVLAIEVPDFRGAASEVKQSTLALLTRAESLRIESDRLTALRDTLLPELLSGHMRIPAEGVVA